MNPRTTAEEAYWATWEVFLDHGAGCAACRAITAAEDTGTRAAGRDGWAAGLCPDGVRLSTAHRQARTRFSDERAAALKAPAAGGSPRR